MVVDFTSSRQEAHSHYVGLSRVKTLEGLHILNLCENKIHVHPRVVEEMAELRSTRNMPLSLYRPYMYNDFSCHAAFLTVRSLHKHIDCIRHDRSLLTCDIHTYCETRVSPNDSTQLYEIDNFNSVMYPAYSRTNKRSHYGLAAYSKLALTHSIQPFTMAPQSSHGTAECALMCVVLHRHLLKVACVYRRPNSDISKFQTAMSHLLNELNAIHTDDLSLHQSTIIMGDFNLDWHDQSTQVLMARTLPGFRQLVTEPTTDYGSTLDHIYTDLPPDLVQHFTLESYYSDHKPLVAALRLPL